MERGGWPFIYARMEGDRGSLWSVVADRRRSLRDGRGVISGEEEGEGRVGADVGVPHVSDRKEKRKEHALLVCWLDGFGPFACASVGKREEARWAGSLDGFLNKKLFPIFFPAKQIEQKQN